MGMPPGLEKFLVTSSLHYPTFFEDGNPLRCPNRREPVGDDKGRPTIYLSSFGLERAPRQVSSLAGKRQGMGVF